MDPGGIAATAFAEWRRALQCLLNEPLRMGDLPDVRAALERLSQRAAYERRQCDYLRVKIWRGTKQRAMRRLENAGGGRKMGRQHLHLHSTSSRHMSVKSTISNLVRVATKMRYGQQKPIGSIPAVRVKMTISLTNDDHYHS